MMFDWQNESAFLQMDKKKQDMILLLSETLEGKKITEALPYLLKWKQQMQRDNIIFTKAENELLTHLFSSKLTPSQKQQFEYLKHFIK